MEIDLSLSLLISIGGIIASCASAFAIVRTKVTQMENLISALDKQVGEVVERQSDSKIKLALLETNQANLEKEISEIKVDVKTTMKNVQEIKEAVITAKKGEA